MAELGFKKRGGGYKVCELAEFDEPQETLSNIQFPLLLSSLPTGEVDSSAAPPPPATAASFAHLPLRFEVVCGFRDLSVELFPLLPLASSIVISGSGCFLLRDPERIVGDPRRSRSWKNDRDSPSSLERLLLLLERSSGEPEGDRSMRHDDVRASNSAASAARKTCDASDWASSSVRWV